jgi:UDP-GlcNAc:undecaprenyl-phosphate GlcNAc-1-phosphate transferase
MKMIIFFFVLSFLLSLAITPIVRDLALRYGLMDRPSDRKVHIHPLPRVGGAALYLSFILTFCVALWFSTFMPEIVMLNKRTVSLILGASMAFGVGFWDDLKRLEPWIKLSVQVIAALIACCLGDICFHTITLPWVGSINLGWFGVPATIFWFLMIINGINLIDGLDGLAAGIVFFVSLVLVLLCILNNNHIVAFWLAAVAGTSLGFLRYNFNPASIFMGDSGSYFLGYIIAALSTMGFIKGQAAVAILIPMIALGLPIFDTLLAPVRRFIAGKAMFRPDNGHIHHRLLAMGMTTRRAVFICYIVTIILGLTALFIVHTTSEKAGLLLLLIGVVAVAGVRKLGYFDYVTSEKIAGWFRDVTDEAGFSQERRTFLDIQVAIGKTGSIEELWEQTSKALIKMDIDQAVMNINGHQDMQWTRQGYDSSTIRQTFLMRVELPLISPNKEQPHGKLILIKDLRRAPISHFTLRRMEHLRRSITGVLNAIVND